ncbi:antibiotic biosynthesis monooxygenase (plasmid) [Kitasatospora sp. NBC_00070]|uniref:putative quinol monooxygenase n=1 Tax=Kitasatospora sp. NBC_00070 TaxID=2975962 RepID=UPI002F91B025
MSAAAYDPFNQKRESMSLRVMAEMWAAPDKEHLLRSTLEGIVGPSLAEPGAIAYTAFVDPNDPARWLTVEEWADQDALEAHFQSPHFQQAVRTLEDVLVKPATLHRLIPA